MDTPRPQEIYRHFKGNLYQIVTIAEHSETGESLVIYQALYGECKVYARPLDMFLSLVDKQKYPESTQTYRFERVNTLASSTVVKSESDDHDPEADFKLDPNLDAFLEAEKYKDKLKILLDNKNYWTEDMLQTMAYSLEFTFSEGDLLDKYESLKRGLMVLEKYEGNRLR